MARGQEGGEGAGPALRQEDVVAPGREAGEESGPCVTRGRRRVPLGHDAGKGEVTGPGAQTGRVVATDPACRGEQRARQATGRSEEGRWAARRSVPAGRSRPYQLAGLLPVIRVDLGPNQTPSREGSVP